MALSSDEYIHYQETIAANTTIIIPITSYNKNVKVNGEDTNVTFVFSGIERDVGADTWRAHWEGTYGGGEYTLITANSSYSHAGFIYVCNRAGTAKYFSIGIEQ